MPTLALYLTMSLAGFAIFVFVSESFNPFRRSFHSVFLRRRHWIGIVGGLAVALSPVALYLRPAASLHDKILVVLATAFFTLLLILLFVTLLYLIRSGKDELENRKNPSKKNTRKPQRLDTRNVKASTPASQQSDNSQIKPGNDSLQQRIASPLALDNNKPATRGDTMQVPTVKDNHIDLDKHIQNTDPNDELRAELEEAEIEMRQGAAFRRQNQDSADSVVEAQPILEPRTSEDQSKVMDQSFTLEDSIEEAVIVDIEKGENEKVANQDSIDFKTEEKQDHTEDTLPLKAPLRSNTRDSGTLTSAVKTLSDEVYSAEAALQQMSSFLDEEATHRSKQNRLLEQTIAERSKTISQQQTQIVDDAEIAKASDDLMSEQTREINRARTYSEKLEALLVANQERLEAQRKDLDKSRAMARNAAILARQAAVAHHKAKAIADQEKQVRHRVEQKAKKAVQIAENAISALAREEQRNAKVN